MATLLERIANGRTDLVIERGPRPSGNRRRLSLRSLGENLGLGAAASHGHWRPCEFLLENPADALFREPDTGEAPLHPRDVGAVSDASECSLDGLSSRSARSERAKGPPGPWVDGVSFLGKPSGGTPHLAEQIFG